MEGLRTSLMTFANVTVDRARLARHARKYLYGRGCLISRAREIESQVRRAVLAVEQIGVKQVEEVVPGKLRDSWVSRLLSEVDPGPMTVLEWIRRPPKKRSPSTLSDAATKPPNWGALDFAAITPGRKTAYFPRFFESAAARY